MKHVMLIVGILLIAAVPASAQQTAVGVTGKGLKLGLDFATINTDYNELDEFLDTRTGFSGGAFLTYSLNRQFAVQPELLFVTKGAYKGSFLFSAYWDMYYLEVPVLLRFDMAPEGRLRPYLLAGPAVSVLLSSKIGALGYDYTVTDGMHKLDLGLVFGGELDYRRMVFDIRYTLGLLNTVDAAKVNKLTGAEPDDFYYLEGDPSVKNDNLSFMIGLRF
jgi:opacity protein-like surface antigen